MERRGPATPVQPPDYFEVVKPNYPPPAYHDGQDTHATTNSPNSPLPHEAAPPYTERDTTAANGHQVAKNPSPRHVSVQQLDVSGDSDLSDSKRETAV